MKVTPVKKKWMDVVNSDLGAGSIISRTQVQEFMKKYDLKWPTYFMSGPYVVSKGKYIFPSDAESLESKITSFFGFFIHAMK